MTIEFWVSIGRETYECMEKALIAGAGKYDLDVKFTPTGGQILDLGVRLKGAPDRVEAYVDWFCDVIELCIAQEV